MGALQEALTNHAGEKGLKDVVVKPCVAYAREKSHDGVDICADRAADEIVEVFDAYKRQNTPVTRFSILG